MLIGSKELFKISQKGGYAIPAPNFFNFDSAKAYVEVAEELGLPLMLCFAEVHLELIDLEDAAMIGQYLGEKASVPVVLHLDHGMTPSIIKRAIDLGFTSVMIDASSKPFEENVALTKDIVEYAHKKGVVVEAEIGYVGSGVNYENHEVTDSVYTEVEEAVEFVKQTNVDSLAISIGTAHGFYHGTPEINFERLEEISKAIDTPLVLHGGSSSGDTNLQKCAMSGISKINIFTDIITAGYECTQKNEHQDLLTQRALAIQGMKDKLKHYYKVFNTQKVNI